MKGCLICVIFWTMLLLGSSLRDIFFLFYHLSLGRDEKLFDDLMDNLIIHDQALKTAINNVELLIFSSRELPPELWRKLFTFPFFIVLIYATFHVGVNCIHTWKSIC